MTVEPEAANLGHLKQLIRRLGVDRLVICYEGVAADTDGTPPLKINPYHPGDHKINQGNSTKSDRSVRSIRLDTLVESIGRPQVSLIKIDVQGAEKLVLDGADTIIARDKPTLFIEVDAAALREFETTDENLFSRLVSRGYQIYLPIFFQTMRELTIEEAMEELNKSTSGCLDFFFVPVRSPLEDPVYS